MSEVRTESGATSYHWVIDAQEVEMTDEEFAITAANSGSWNFWAEPGEDAYE